MTSKPSRIGVHHRLELPLVLMGMFRESGAEPSVDTPFPSRTKPQKIIGRKHVSNLRMASLEQCTYIEIEWGNRRFPVSCNLCLDHRRVSTSQSSGQRATFD